MKTTKPISVLVIGMDPTPALEQLVADGHGVCYMNAYGGFIGDMTKFDIVLGPKCWRYLPDVSDKFIKLIVKEARAAQPAKPKRVKKEKTSASG